MTVYYFVSCSNLRKMNLCWNNVRRKVFNMNILESVKCIQLFCGRAVKECFRNIRYDVMFRKLCLDYDVMIDGDSVYDITFILSLSHCVDCSLSVLSVFIFTVFRPT